MKRRKRRGGGRMLAGLLMLAAALALTLWNVCAERRGEREAASELAALKAELPRADVPAAADDTGAALDWPVDADGAPAAWPVDADGMPVPSVVDALGRCIAWSGDSDAAGWTRSASGGLLPWLRDSAGNLIAWPADANGAPLSWAELTVRWHEILAARMPSVLATEQPAYVRNPDMEMPLKKVDGRYYIGVLEIPALELELPVMEEWNYPNLRIAPCRYAGSVYSGDVVIAGHNYARHFGGLKNLKPGDAVRFTDADGNVFSYTVTALEILGKSDGDRMCQGDWDMTLFTCTYGGAKRVTVRLKRN